MTWTPEPALTELSTAPKDRLHAVLVAIALELAVAGFPRAALRVWGEAYRKELPANVGSDVLDRCPPMVLAALVGTPLPPGILPPGAKQDPMALATETDAFVRSMLLRVGVGRPIPTFDSALPPADAPPSSLGGWMLLALSLRRSAVPADLDRGLDVLLALVDPSRPDAPWTKLALTLAADGLAARGDDERALQLLVRLLSRPDAEPRQTLSLLPLARYHVDDRFGDPDRTEAAVDAFVADVSRVVAQRVSAPERSDGTTHHVTTLDNHFTLEPKDHAGFVDFWADPTMAAHGWAVSGNAACISMPGEAAGCDVTLVLGPQKRAREPVHAMRFRLDVVGDLYARTAVDDLRFPVPPGTYDVEVAFLAERLDDADSDLPTWEVELRLTKAAAVSAPAPGARRFELVEGTSSKFWEVSVDGASFTVRYGRIGSDGTVKTKACADEAEAQAEAEKLVREKTRKGYAEVAG